MTTFSILFLLLTVPVGILIGAALWLGKLCARTQFEEQHEREMQRRAWTAWQAREALKLSGTKDRPV